MFTSIFRWLFGASETQPTVPQPPEPTAHPTPPSPPIDLGTPVGPVIATDDNGEIDLGRLAPVVPSMLPTAAMERVLHDPNTALDVAKLNQQTGESASKGLFNAFYHFPKDASGEPVVGPYDSGSDAFVGKGISPSACRRRSARRQSSFPPKRRKRSGTTWTRVGIRSSM